MKKVILYDVHTFQELSKEAQDKVIKNIQKTHDMELPTYVLEERIAASMEEWFGKNQKLHFEVLDGGYPVACNGVFSEELTLNVRLENFNKPEDSEVVFSVQNDDIYSFKLSRFDFCKEYVDVDFIFMYCKESLCDLYGEVCKSSSASPSKVIWDFSDHNKLQYYEELEDLQTENVALFWLLLSVERAIMEELKKAVQNFMSDKGKFLSKVLLDMYTYHGSVDDVVEVLIDIPESVYGNDFVGFTYLGTPVILPEEAVDVTDHFFKHTD